ncbi:SitI3 family protein [Actinoplanes sp. NPDC023801]|uniref:SitI3 family protein n=1 Tax=Actinoplanes sp. NPDC023801 TaxID=3154595 RepID=UPI0033DB1FE9
MALEYKLVLIGATSPEQVRQRAFPGREDELVEIPPLLTADLQERLGFHVTIRAKASDYIEVETNGGMWDRKLLEHVSLTFRMDESADSDWYITNMITVVHQLLETGSEDALLILDHDTLLLARHGGTLAKHDRDGWWDHFPAADQLIPG